MVVVAVVIVVVVVAVVVLLLFRASLVFGLMFALVLVSCAYDVVNFFY